MVTKKQSWTMGVMLLVGLVLGTGGQVTADDYAERRTQLGHGEKLRIMVDKVACGENKGRLMSEANVKLYADAGFNVIVPRNGAHDFDDVRRMAKLAREHDVYYMPWIRGATETLGEDSTTGNPTAERHKIVWKNGTVQDKYSPNSDGLWDWLGERVLTYAKISVGEPSLIGLFLDYENYKAPRGVNWTVSELSYDLTILEKFAAAQGVTLPELSPESRATWLTEQGQHEAFRDFQYAHWRERCATLRQAVDAINPTFQFCVYPTWGTFLQKAAWREWATNEAPLIVADHATYGRPNGPQASGLAHGAELMQRLQQKVDTYAEKYNVPLLLIGGIDPIVYRSPDYEFAGKNAVAISEQCDGYWVFYELKGAPSESAAVPSWPVHNGYVEWFAKGNEAIYTGKLAFWRQ